MGILHRYVLKELVAPVFLSVVFFTFIMLLGQLFGMAELLLEARVGWETILDLLGTVAISLIILTIPMAALLGCLMGIGRLTSENELLAIRVAGISLTRVFWPVLFIAFIGSLGLMWAGFSVVPGLVKRLTDKQTEIQFRILTNLEPGRNYTSLAPRGSDISLYFESIGKPQPEDGDYVLRMDRVAMRVAGETYQLTGAPVFEHRAPAALDPLAGEQEQVMYAPRETILFARAGTVVGNMDERSVTITLFDGTMTPLNRMTVDPTDNSPLYRESPNRGMMVQFDTLERNLTPRMDERLDRQDPRQWTHENLLNLTSEEPQEPLYRDERRRLLSTNWRVYLNARNELYQRYSLPFSLMAFVLIAIPLAVELRPRSKTIAFLIAISLILLYYVMITWAGAIGMTNSPFTLPAFLLPNVVIGGAGLWLFWRTQR